MLQAIDKWHKTKAGYIVFGLAELVLAYGFASWAIDSGQLWQYLVAFVLLGGSIHNLIRFFSAIKHEHNRD